MELTVNLYSSSILALGLFGALYLAQLLVADVAGIARRHTPGTAISGDHGDFLFRASRAHANTTESVGAVILIAGFAALRGAEPGLVSILLWSFLACRVVHTVAYYLDQQILRSVAFAGGVLALVVLLGAGLLS